MFQYNSDIAKSSTEESLEEFLVKITNELKHQ